MLLLLMACQAPWRVFVREADRTPKPQWPRSSEGLEVLPRLAPRHAGRPTVFVVGGHYNNGKKGNTGAHGQFEAQTNLKASEDLVERLAQLKQFDLVLGRKGEETPSYRTRILHAAKVDAKVFLELHTDARGPLNGWASTPTQVVYRNTGHDGFSVLYNESGELGPSRRCLARYVARSLLDAGFPSYKEGYGDLYDEDEPGVFIDRRGLMMLRRPSMPSVIIETHNAKDFEESLRWREPAVADAFAAAMAQALTKYFTEGCP